MAMLQGPSTAALGIPANPSVEGVDVVAVAQPGGAETTSTTGSHLPIATSSTNRHKEGGSGRLSQRVALIDPKPLTRQSIQDLLTEAVPEYAMVAVSTCEELLEIDERQFGRPNIIVVYTEMWVNEPVGKKRARASAGAAPRGLNRCAC